MNDTLQNKNYYLISINSIPIYIFLDNNGNLYFEKENIQYQVIINKNNYLELDEGDYSIIPSDQVNNMIKPYVEYIDYNIVNFNEINTFNIFIFGVDQQLPVRNNGLASALYNVEYYNDNKKSIYTEIKDNTPLIMDIQIHTNSNGETFLYSKDIGCTGLVKYNLKINNNKLICEPDIK